MNILKNEISYHRYELILSNELNDKFLIHFAGGDLYWTMLDYHDNNEFVITKNDKILYEWIENLFIEIADKERYSELLKNNTFQWSSEAYGLLENANRLTILKDFDKYIIKFYQNPTKMVFRKDICTVCFCLSGSRYQDIANMFSYMFYTLLENKNILIRKKY